jgi:phosphatidylglycerol:prolipoprotein diacylglycerol transferase
MPTTLASYFHDLSPIIFTISGDFAVRWYGVSYVVGFVIAYIVLYKLSKRGLIMLPAQRVPDAMMVIILGTLLGGRLGYAILGYDPSLLYTFTSSFPYWNMLALQKGGMASHGAMIGLVIAAWIVSRGFKPDRDPQGPREGVCSTFHVMDYLALTAGFGLFFGRIANFVNGELLGAIITKPGEKGPWYSVQFPQELSGWLSPLARDVKSHTPELSVEQMGKLNELVTSVQRVGQSWTDALHSIIAHPGAYRAQLEPLLSSRHPSQLYQAIAEGLVLTIFVWIVWARPRKAGVVASCWLMLYGVLRIVTEIWRLPDAQFTDGRPLGLSRGQWFSAAMVGFGLLVLIWSVKRAGPRIGGWLGSTAKSES